MKVPLFTTLAIYSYSTLCMASAPAFTFSKTRTSNSVMSLLLYTHKGITYEAMKTVKTDADGHTKAWIDDARVSDHLIPKNAPEKIKNLMRKELEQRDAQALEQSYSSS